MNKKLIPVLLVLSIFSLMLIGASCSTTQGGQASGKSFRTGSEGLEMKFLAGNPPGEIMTGVDNIPIVIEVRNKGAYPSTNEQFRGDIYLSGYDPQILKISPTHIQLSSDDLFGRNEMYQQGGMQRVYDFKIGSVALYGGDKSQQKIMATACYQYATIVEAPICVDPDPYGITIKDKVCSAKDVTLTSQGGPVTVTKIEQDMLKDRIQFTIHIKHLGKGTATLFSTDSYSNCPDKISYENLNKVVIEEASLGGRPLTCSAGSYGKPVYIPAQGKSGGEGIAVCTTSGGFTKQDAAYQSTIMLKLAYAYRDTASATVNVIKLPE